MKPGIDYVKGYSIALLGLGFFFLLGALQFRFTMPGTKDNPAFSFIAGILCLLGIPCLVVAILRWLRVAAALPATAALSVCLLIGFPVGTLLSLYWFARVKPREQGPREKPQRTWFLSAVVLYILGFLFLDMALVLRFVWALDKQVDPILQAFERGGWIVAAAVLAAGDFCSARASSPRLEGGI